MNAATSRNDLVPLSQPLRRGTVGQSPECGTACGTTSGTASLKSLAIKVLQRSKLGQSVGQVVGQGQKACPTGVKGLGQQNGVAPPLVPANVATGLEWIDRPTDDTAPDFDSRWAAFDLADFGKLFGVRVIHAGERILAVYPPGLEPELVAHASELLADARPYLAVNLDKLPILTPSEAVTSLRAIMRQHPGLRFCRGEEGSRWPLYPCNWTAEQRGTVQALWFVGGEALDLDSVTEMEV